MFDERANWQLSAPRLLLTGDPLSQIVRTRLDGVNGWVCALSLFAAGLAHWLEPE